MRRAARRPVHPHASGEDSWCSVYSSPLTGSPPREWGRPVAAAVTDACARFTPTRVGKTSGPRVRPPPHAVHPHASGEDLPAGPATHHAVGSPPREWGRLSGPPACCRASRFTPTRVGKTPWGSPAAPAPPVHPHASGEDDTAARRLSGGGGSPPREWGRRGGRGEPLRRRRFTPTRVGKTCSPPVNSSSTTVHPHASGEDWYSGTTPSEGAGSPPREWGRRREQLRHLELRRFTPTRVGKTPRTTG